jgi:hypothetical protein
VPAAVAAVTQHHVVLTTRVTAHAAG